MVIRNMDGCSASSVNPALRNSAGEQAVFLYQKYPNRSGLCIYMLSNWFIVNMQVKTLSWCVKGNLVRKDDANFLC